MRAALRRPGSALASSLALLLACAPSSCTPAPRPGGAILIVLDTLRADHVGVYGHHRPTSENLDRLAAKGVLFEQAVAYTSWTLPSMVAMLSARYPTRHTYDRTLQVSLVQTLERAGFSTAALTEGGFVSRLFGLDRGFGFFHEGEGPVKIRLDGEAVGGIGGGGAEATFGMAARWLRSHASERFFLLIHTYEVHAPYNRRHYAAALDSGALGPTFELADRGPIRSGDLVLGEREIAYLSALYDGGVRAADRLVGALLEALDALDLARSTLVVVTSDHGEEFGRRHPRFAGDHGHSLYDELIRIPLILYDPTLAPTRQHVSAQVRSVDILPTILDRLGVAVPEGLDGRSLVPLLTGAERGDRIAIAELDRHGPPREAARSGAYKLIRSRVRGGDGPARGAQEPGVELYDLTADPHERANLAPLSAGSRTELPAQSEPFVAALAARRSQLAREGRSDFELHRVRDARARERLRALGYTE